jgi:hypothetical protein
LTDRKIVKDMDAGFLLRQTLLVRGILPARNLRYIANTMD